MKCKYILMFLKKCTGPRYMHGTILDLLPGESTGESWFSLQRTGIAESVVRSSWRHGYMKHGLNDI